MLAQKGYSPQYGARPLKRAIRNRRFPRRNRRLLRLKSRRPWKTKLRQIIRKLSAVLRRLTKTNYSSRLKTRFRSAIKSFRPKFRLSAPTKNATEEVAASRLYMWNSVDSAAAKDANKELPYIYGTGANRVMFRTASIMAQDTLLVPALKRNESKGNDRNTGASPFRGGAAEALWFSCW